MLVNTIQWSMKEQMNAVQLPSQTTFSCILHYHLQQKHIQVIKLNYKKKWNLHKNSQAVKNGAAHAKKTTAWKQLWNQRLWPRSSCDGRIMSKFLITTIEVGLVPFPCEAWRRQHIFSWIVVIKNFAIILPSQLLLGRHLWFHNFFHVVVFCMGHTFFTTWLLLCRLL